jgi:hypothetical protein
MLERTDSFGARKARPAHRPRIPCNSATLVHFTMNFNTLELQMRLQRYGNAMQAEDKQRVKPPPWNRAFGVRPKYPTCGDHHFPWEPHGDDSRDNRGGEAA